MEQTQFKCISALIALCIFGVTAKSIQYRLQRTARVEACSAGTYAR